MAVLALLAPLHAACGGSTPPAGPDAGVPDAPPPDAGEDPMDQPDGLDCNVPFTQGVSTLAGCSNALFVDGSRSIARFSDPVNVAYRGGAVYVADFDNGKLRVIDVATRVTSTLIDPPNFKRPFALAFASDATLYVSTDNDKDGNHSVQTGTIWKVDVPTKAFSVVANAIGRPRGIAVLPDGRLAVTDYQHHVVEIVDPSNGLTTVIAGSWDVQGADDGSGSIARFDAPYGVVLGSDGKLIIADYGNSLIRQVALDGATTTLSGRAGAGFADGPLATARFDHPQGVTIGTDGTVYVSDMENYRVRRIAGGQVATVAGDGTGGFLDADDPLASELYGLEGLSVTPDGATLYVADGNRGEDVPFNRIRQIKLP